MQGILAFFVALLMAVQPALAQTTPDKKKPKPDAADLMVGVYEGYIQGGVNRQNTDNTQIVIRKAGPNRVQIQSSVPEVSRASIKVSAIDGTVSEFFEKEGSIHLDLRESPPKLGYTAEFGAFHGVRISDKLP